MAIKLENPVKPFTVEAPSIRHRKVAATQAATMRAEFRFVVAKLAASTEGSLRDKQKAIEAAIRAGLITGHAPSREAIRRLEHAYRSGKDSAGAFRDDLTPRGPRAEPFRQDLLEKIKERAVRHGVADLEQLAYLVSADAKQLGLGPVSVWRLRRALCAIGTLSISAGRHGSRAAEFDAATCGAYPTTHTHEIWHLDEGDSRYWAKAICRIHSNWISVRPSVILIRDHHSGAFVTGYVVDPTRRINKEDNSSFRTGFDADDVLAALLTAVVPDLAAPGVRELSGVLPEKLRWDNAKAHIALESLLFSRGRVHLVDNVGDPDADEFPPILDSSRIQVRRPDRNGMVERMMPLVKRWMVGKEGHVDERLPDDQLEPGEDLGRERSKIAVSHSKRQPSLSPVSVESLPTIEELQEALNEVLRRYNEDHRLARHGLTPLGAARKYMPKRRRSGEDLIRAMEVNVYQIQRAGIQVQREGKRVTFRPEYNGVLLQPGSSAQVYVDPMLRRVWLEQGRTLVALKPTQERAAEQEAGHVAQAISDIAREESDKAVEIREKAIDAAYGPGAAERGRKKYEASRDAQRPPKGATEEGGGRRRPGAAPRPSPASQWQPEPDDPAGFDAFDPDALLPPEPDDLNDLDQ